MSTETPSAARAATVHDDEDDPNEVELAWADEIGRRVERVREGTAATVSEEEFLRRMRAAI